MRSTARLALVVIFVATAATAPPAAADTRRKDLDPVTDAQVSEKQGPHNVLHCNPLFVALGWVHVAYGRVLHDHVSLQIEPGVILPWDGDGIVVTVDARPIFHFVRPAPAGLYLTPFARIWYEARDSWEGHDLRVIPGAAIGWSWVFGPMTARIGGGAIVPITLTEHRSLSGWTFDFSGLMPVLPYLEGAIGFAF